MRDGWKNNTVLYGNKRQEKKKGFFQGEVFFLLTRPLMGDPVVSLEIKNIPKALQTLFGISIYERTSFKFLIA